MTYPFPLPYILILIAFACSTAASLERMIIHKQPVSHAFRRDFYLSGIVFTFILIFYGVTQ